MGDSVVSIDKLEKEGGDPLCVLPIELISMRLCALSGLIIGPPTASAPPFPLISFMYMALSASPLLRLNQRISKILLCIHSDRTYFLKMNHPKIKQTIATAPTPPITDPMINLAVMGMLISSYHNIVTLTIISTTSQSARAVG